MGCPNVTQSIEVIIEETEGGVALKSVNNSEKSALNGNEVVVLDFHQLFVNSTRAAIDPSAIVSLNLSRSNLNYFPDGFAGLELKRLDLSHNKLQNVPNCILNGLRSLEILNLSHNALRSFADEPKCVKSLRILKIDNNYLSDIPQWILRVNAFNLEELYYSNNDVTSLQKSQFFKKASYELAKLEMKNCLVRTQDLKYIKQIRTLTFLDLSNESAKNRNCFASCDSFRTLFDKPLWDDRLKVLHLNDLQIAFLPEEISQLTALEELYLAKNDLMWMPDSIILMDKLRILDLSFNQLACFPDAISNLKNLEILRAPHNCISRVEDFSSMRLKMLDLYNNYLDTDCDIKIDCTVLQVDLEQNFLDTSGFGHEGYEVKKCSLRTDASESRINGPKQQECDDIPSSDDSDESEWGSPPEYPDNEPLRDESEEGWSSTDYKCKPSDIGVTPSDNEWTGRETVRKVIRKKRKPLLENCPSWMFQDAEG